MVYVEKVLMRTWALKDDTSLSMTYRELKATTVPTWIWKNLS